MKNLDIVIDSQYPHEYLASGVRVDFDTTHTLVGIQLILEDGGDPGPVLHFSGKPDLVRDFLTPLSRLPRFSGQVGGWSVLDHTLLVASMVKEPLDIFSALFHDFQEAITSDIPSPVKCLIPGFREWETLALKDILKALEFPFEWAHPEDILTEDGMSCVVEFNQFLRKTQTEILANYTDNNSVSRWLNCFYGALTMVLNTRALRRDSGIKAMRAWKKYIETNYPFQTHVEI